jgi:hypothetical protein
MSRQKNIGVVCVALLLGASFAMNTQAEIYKKVLPDGSVVFTDDPKEGGQKIDVPPLPIIGFPKKADPKAAATTSSDKRDKKEPTDSASGFYKSFTVSEPTADSAMRANDGSVNVTLSLQPPLDTKKAHKIVFILDGKPVTQPATGLATTLEGLDRGSHTVSAEVRDSQGAVLKAADPVIFHVLRYIPPAK